MRFVQTRIYIHFSMGEKIAAKKKFIAMGDGEMATTVARRCTHVLIVTCEIVTKLQLSRYYMATTTLSFSVYHPNNVAM